MIGQLNVAAMRVQGGIRGKRSRTEMLPQLSAIDRLETALEYDALMERLGVPSPEVELERMEREQRERAWREQERDAEERAEIEAMVEAAER